MTPQNEHCSKCIYNNVRQKIVNLLDSLAELATFCAVYVRSVTLYGKYHQMHESWTIFYEVIIILFNLIHCQFL